MRTTLDLDRPILDELKALQKTEKRSLGRIASRLLAEALASGAASGQKTAKLEWTTKKMRSRVNLADKEAVYRAMEQS